MDKASLWLPAWPATLVESPESEWITPGTLLVMCFKGGITESEADLARGDYRGWVFSSTAEL